MSFSDSEGFDRRGETSKERWLSRALIDAGMIQLQFDPAGRGCKQRLGVDLHHPAKGTRGLLWSTLGPRIDWA